MSKTVVYQIYPLSFYDTTGRGTGDIRGVIAKLDYLKSLGVDYIWLTPVFRSLFRDNGYDVVDYYHVDPRFGTDDDLVALIAEAKKRDLKIMLDMVFNHTSTASAWFQGWLQGDPAYRDFYFRQVRAGQPPTNWQSKFGGSAWKEYAPGQWYLHLFDETQADLNWDNPHVRHALKAVLQHYIQLGVSGFRFDVINLISKGPFEDDLTGDGRRFYTDGPHAHAYVAEISALFPKSRAFLTVGELSSTTLTHTIRYANAARTELDSAFTFHHLKVDYAGLDKFVARRPDIALLHKILSEWSSAVHRAGATMANFWNNHDQPRSVSRFAPARFWKRAAKMLFALTNALPGITYIFQGEEIGMTNPGFTRASQYRDVETLNYLHRRHLAAAPRGVQQKSRDNSRTPMQWNGERNAGFTTGTPWIDLAPNYKLINVARAEQDSDSILHFYRQFIQLSKKFPVFTAGDIEWAPYADKALAFTRAHQGQTYWFVFSFNSQPVAWAHPAAGLIATNVAPRARVKDVLLPFQFLIYEGA